MQERHKNRKRYFDEQAETTTNYVIPFIRKDKAVTADSRVLEIGCGEAGNLLPFLDMGCEVVGNDLSEPKIENARAYFGDHPHKDRITLYADDFYNSDPKTIGTFDIILMRDVIEHIHDQAKFMTFIQQFLRPGGVIYFGFPPWQNPFGGHQQVCRNKYLSILPYYHLLPRFMYVGILKLFGEKPNTIEGLLEVRDTGISIERFERIVKQTGYKINLRTLYLFNPNYHIKFGLKPRKQIRLITAIPYVRNYWVTAGYYLISRK